MGTLAEIVLGRDSCPNSTDPSRAVREFLSEAGLPSDIQEDLCLATSESSAEICHGGITVIASQQLQALNHDPLYRPWFDSGYLTIASGACGDPICVDVRTERIAYIQHEEMDHLNPELVPSDHVIHTPLSYHQFWQRILDNQPIPCDADFAEAKWGRAPRGA